MDWIILFVLIIIVLLFSIIEKKMYHTWLTPYNILAIPYCVTVIITFLFAEQMGFIPLYVPSIIVWIIGLFVFWLGSAMIRLLTTEQIIANRKEACQERYDKIGDKIDMIPLIIFWVSIMICVLNFLSIISRQGLLFLYVREEYQAAFTDGLYGWALVAIMFFLTYFIGNTHKDKIIVNVAILLGMVILLFNQVKGLIFLPIIGGLIYRYISGRLTITITKVLMALVAVYFLFMMTYLLAYVGLVNRNEILTDTDVYRDLSRHLFSYLYSGVLALGDAMEHSLRVSANDQAVIIAPIYNFLRHLFGWARVENVTQYYTHIDLLKESSSDSNVHTMIGTIYLFLRGPFAIVYLLSMSCAIYYLYWKSIATQNSWVMVTYAFIASALPFGWFEYYYWHAFFIQGAIFGMVMFVLDKLHRKDVA